MGEAGRGDPVEDCEAMCIGMPECEAVVVTDDDDDDDRTRWASMEAEPMRWSGDGDPPDDGV